MLRENLFKFATEYAKACNIPKVGIGRVETNDIEWKSLPEMTVAPVDKAGGYLENYTSGNNRAGLYYLEAYNTQTLGEIYNESREEERSTIENKKEKTGSFVIVNLDGNTESHPYTNQFLNEILDGNRRDIVDENSVNEIQNIEDNAFGNISATREMLLNNLQNTQGVQILFKENNEIMGSLTSKPASEFIPWTNHSLYNTLDTTLYLESISGKTDLYQALDLLKKEAKKSGYSTLSLHGLNPRLNRLLHRAGFKTKEVVDDYLGKEAEYMEMEI
jgi:hypothetical protein